MTPSSTGGGFNPPLKNVRRGAPLPKGQKLRARPYTGYAEGSGRPLIGD